MRRASRPRDADVDIATAAVADGPALQLLGNTDQRQVFSTGWQSALNVSTQSTLVGGGVFEGWGLITGIDTHGIGLGMSGGKDGFDLEQRRPDGRRLRPSVHGERGCEWRQQLARDQ